MLVPLWSFLRKLAGRMTVTWLLDEILNRLIETEKVAVTVKDKIGVSEEQFINAMDSLGDIQTALEDINKKLSSFADGLKHNYIKLEGEKTFIPRLEGLVGYTRAMRKLFKQENIRNVRDSRYVEAYKSLEDLKGKVEKLQREVVRLKFLSPHYS